MFDPGFTRGLRGILARGAVALALLSLAACSGGTGSAGQGTLPQATTAPASATSPQAPASAPQVSPTQQSASPAGQPQVVEILEQGQAYQPSRVTVKAGAPVRFLIRNDDADPHNISSGQVQFPQNQQDPGKITTLDWIAPTRPGTYEAVCAFHAPDMKMTIVVQ